MSFNQILPEGLRFINKQIGKKDLRNILSSVFDDYDMEETVRVANTIKNLGFEYATESASIYQHLRCESTRR